MSKDRAAPFSRKHIRYWLPVTGGMVLIGTICLSVGFCSYEPPPPAPQKIELVLPPSIYGAPPADAAAATADALAPPAPPAPPAGATAR